MQTWDAKTQIRPVYTDKRCAERRAVNLPARLAWKDQNGVNRFASVVTRDLSEYGAYVEFQSPLSIPLFRIVQFQLEPGAREALDIPESLRRGRVLSAVYRKSPAGRSARGGVALRLMVEPKRRTVAGGSEAARATA
jgi:hypothetical protein